MIATFIIDWPVLGLLGFVFGAFATGDAWWRSRAFRAGLAGATVFTGTAIVSYFVAPDWMWMYLIDPDPLSWTVPLMVPAYLFVYVVSFAAAVALHAARPILVWLAAGVAALMEVAIVAITWDRYHLVGTATEWHRGLAHELFDVTPTGDAQTVGYMGPLVVVTIAVCLIVTYRGSRRASATDR